MLKMNNQEIAQKNTIRKAFGMLLIDPWKE